VINVGDTVTWTNNDKAPHTATSNTGVWDSGILNNGQMFSFQFMNPGVFPYFCGIHAGMKGTITVNAASTPTNTPTPTPTDTPTATPTSAGTPSISGVVSYGLSASSPTPTPKFISGASVCANGLPTVCAGTNSAGQYTLTGFGSGNYTVGVTKTTQLNGISSNDAARIAQHVAGVSGQVFTVPVQFIAADVSSNGAVSSNDAARIAQYVAGVSPLPQPNLTGVWRFFAPNPTFPIGSSPTSYTYPEVSGQITNQDFWGVLGGEVSGNWNPLGPRPAKGPERSIAAELPDIASEPGKEIVIPVNVRGAANKEIVSYEFDLSYDPSVIQPTVAAVDLKDTASRTLSVVTNATEPGLLRVVVYGAMPITEEGLLLNLRFTAIGSPGSVSPLSFAQIMFNEGEPRISVVDGRVKLF